MALGSLVLGNPAAIWALLAIPVLLGIHLLQQTARRMETSTLFLLERIAPESSEGRRIDWIKSSLSLWLQLLAILAITWVLVEPCFVEAGSVQRAVIVLDSSASMSVFRTSMIAEVDRLLAEIERSAGRTEWIAMDSDVQRKTIYSGTDRERAMEAVRAFEPTGGAHDFDPALSVARGLARNRGPIVLVTDHEVSVPAGVHLLAVGRPIDNVGFTGLRVQRTEQGVEWTAMVKNHGRTRAVRTFAIDGADAREISLEPGEARTFRGKLPDRARLTLSPDEFTLDDSVPMVRPRAKLLRLYVEPEVQSYEVVQRLTAGLESAALLSDARGADLVIAGRRADQRIDADAIVFSIDDAPEKMNELSPALAERSPLTDGLVWQGLVRRKTSHSLLKDEAPILWQADRPLIALRNVGSKKQLIIDFDPRYSNADRLPSFAVLLMRFVESIRAGKVELEAKNLETLQPLELAVAGEEQVVLREEKGEQSFAPRSALTAPGKPGFFFVQQGPYMLLAGAARFGDLREADLSQATSAIPSIDEIRAIALRNGRPDPLRPLWILLAAAACAGAWAYAETRRAAGKIPVS